MIEGNYVFYFAMVFLFAGMSTYFTNIGLETQKYKSSVKPSWYPPGYLFAIAWTIIYGLYVYSWTKASFYPFLNNIFSVNIILNFLWCLMFFYMGNWNIALGILLALNGVLIYQISSFYKYDQFASLLLIPYLLWSCFASFLNYTIIALN